MESCSSQGATLVSATRAPHTGRGMALSLLLLRPCALRPESPSLLGEYVGSNQGVGGHMRHDGVSELSTLTERQRIAYASKGPCQPTAVQQAKQDGRQETRKPRELSRR